MSAFHRSFSKTSNFNLSNKYTNSLVIARASYASYSHKPQLRYHRILPGRRTALAVSAISSGAMAAMTFFSAYAAYRASHPARRTLDQFPTGYLLPPEKVGFKSGDGLNLNGYFYPNPHVREAILICHGFHGAAMDLHEPAIVLQNAGYNVLTFDFRSCGSSEGRTTSAGFWEVQDVLGALTYLKSRPEVDAQAIGLYGFSMGGSTAIMAAAYTPEVKALVTDSAFASLPDLLTFSFKRFFRLPRFPFATTTVWFTQYFTKMVYKEVKPYEALQQLKTTGRRLPILIIHGENDQAVPVSQAQKLFEAAAEPKQLWVVPNSNHVVAHHHDRDEYRQRIQAFFDQYLKTSRSSFLPNSNNQPTARSTWNFLQAD